MKRIANLLLRLQNIIEKDLSEYLKWVIILGLYIFYRMMEKAYDERQLVFLVIPIIFLGIGVFILQWILGPIILFFQLTDRTQKIKPKAKLGAILVACMFILSIIVFIVFYFNEYVVLINLGFLSLLASAITASLMQKNQSRHFKPIFWSGLALLSIGIGGFAYSLIQHNGLNAISFFFYIAFVVFYYITRIDPKRNDK